MTQLTHLPLLGVQHGQIGPDSLDTMSHPIHLHGHYFRVLGSKANSMFPNNMTVSEVKNQMPDSDIAAALDMSHTAPRRDSAHLPENGWLAIRFTANNPGVWLLHCHINSHLSVSRPRSHLQLIGPLN